MNKDDSAYLRDMLTTARKLQALSLAREQYDREETVQAASRYWIQTIGEAASRVSTTFQTAHPEIAWRAIIGMRNRIVHDYLGIDDDVVWEVITRNIPDLITQLEALIADEG